MSPKKNKHNSEEFLKKNTLKRKIKDVIDPNPNKAKHKSNENLYISVKKDKSKCEDSKNNAFSSKIKRRKLSNDDKNETNSEADSFNETSGLLSPKKIKHRAKEKLNNSKEKVERKSEDSDSNYESIKKKKLNSVKSEKEFYLEKESANVKLEVERSDSECEYFENNNSLFESMEISNNKNQEDSDEESSDEEPKWKKNYNQKTQFVKSSSSKKTKHKLKGNLNICDKKDSESDDFNSCAHFSNYKITAKNSNKDKVEKDIDNTEKDSSDEEPKVKRNKRKDKNSRVFCDSLKKRKIVNKDDEKSEADSETKSSDERSSSVKKMSHRVKETLNTKNKIIDSESDDSDSNISSNSTKKRENFHRVYDKKDSEKVSSTKRRQMKNSDSESEDSGTSFFQSLKIEKANKDKKEKSTVKNTSAKKLKEKRSGRKEKDSGKIASSIKPKKAEKTLKNGDHEKGALQDSEKECSDGDYELENLSEECDIKDVNNLLEKYEKNNKISAKDREALRDLKVILKHNVPHQHKIERHAGCHVPTADERRRFQKYIVMKKGTFSPEEDKIIYDNWKDFCKTHNWPEDNHKPFFLMRRDGQLIMRHLEERKRFAQFLANGLPNRTLYSVHHRFRNLFSDHLQKRYTKEDDKIILKYIEDNPNDVQSHAFSDLAKVLNRTRASVWRRYRLLKEKRNS